MGAEPQWIGYVGVDDVDAAAERTKQLGGAIRVPPTDIPDISRFSVVADPQMATLALFKWQNPGQQQPAEPGKPGHVSWHELLAADWEKAFAFYSELFGWQKADADIDPMGTYQLFSTAGQTIGCMFTKPAMVASPFWLFYFNVSDIDAAAARVKAGGGYILEGPFEVPGGSWIARCTDPQGAMFALEEKRGHSTIGYFERGRIARSFRCAGPAMVLVSAADRSLAIAHRDRRLSVGSRRLRAAADHELTDRAFDVEFDPRHLREQLDIDAPDRTSAEPHVGRHHVERLDQDADILQDERICDRAVLP